MTEPNFGSDFYHQIYRELKIPEEPPDREEYEKWQRKYSCPDAENTPWQAFIDYEDPSGNSIG